MGRPLCRQTLGNFQTINAVHPVKVLGDLPGFVALQGADAMPHQARHAFERGDFVHAFLHIVFAKVALAQGGHGGDLIGGEGFGHSQQLHAVELATRLQHRLCDAFT